jgi:hypothetical protein
MSEQKFKSAGNEWWVIVHPEVEQNTEKRFAAGSIQIQDRTVLTVKSLTITGYDLYTRVWNGLMTRNH